MCIFVSLQNLFVPFKFTEYFLIKIYRTFSLMKCGQTWILSFVIILAFKSIWEVFGSKNTFGELLMDCPTFCVSSKIKKSQKLLHFWAKLLSYKPNLPTITKQKFSSKICKNYVFSSSGACNVKFSWDMVILNIVLDAFSTCR